MIQRKHIALAVAAALAMTAPAARAVTVFSDTFGTSTINAAAPAAPTSSSTDYAIASAKNATSSSLTGGILKLSIPSTSSGLAEVQSRFAATPLSLAAEGDFVELLGTFKATNINYIDASGGTFNAGLYNTHGKTPVPGGALANAGLGAGTSNASGNAADWEGFSSRVGTKNSGTPTNALIYTRPKQNTLDPPTAGEQDNENQDLLFNNSGGGAFDYPTGSNLANQATSNVLLVNGSTYTYTFRITRVAGDLLEISHGIYDGAVTTGPNLIKDPLLMDSTPVTQTTTLAQTLTTSFDGFAFGYCAASSPGTPHMLEFSKIEVTSNLMVTPPTENANFDGLGVVDGNDYLIWQQGLGLTGQTNNTNGDANASGIVDGADLTVRRNHFGLASSAGAASPAPEPGALALAAAALAAGFARRRRN